MRKTLANNMLLKVVSVVVAFFVWLLVLILVQVQR